jgi:CRISPR-associated endonuclease Csn1
MAGLTLGLDLGPNSIGWALIDEDEQRIVDLGVRVFPEGVDNFDTKKEKSRNEARRIARGMRRQTKRRAARKRKLRAALIQVGLFPADPAEQERLFELDPYELRVRALSERLAPHEIGRVLLQLNQRRGFLSNRKRDRQDSEVKGMLEEISTLANTIGERTLGQYLHEKTVSLRHEHREPDDHIRNRHTRRSMLESEFERIWEAQAKYYPDLLTEELRYGRQGKHAYPCKPRPRSAELASIESYGIHGMLFFQRNMYWPKSVVGLCELEPKQKRCPRGDRHAQRFRLLQEVNNLRVIDDARKLERPLDTDERALLLDKLSQKSELKFDEIRKLLGQLPDSPAPEQLHFNLERGKRTKLQGMIVDHLMANKHVAGPAWHKRPNEEKNTIVRMLLNNERDDDAIKLRLVEDFGFSANCADAALGIDFPPGYVNLSLMAINRLLPHMERGLIYQSESDPEKSALHAAGYLRRDELQRRLFDRLPDTSRMKAGDCAIGEIPNPVVKRALVELRKVVNAIIREYGKPAAVHVEMARTVRMGPKARSEYNTMIHEREKERDRAAEAIRELGVRVNREGILRYLLWEEQGHECIYCQEPISQQQLFGGDVDVDHILPYSRCLDDSQGNKVVCHRHCNHDKGNRLPHEWVADADPARYERICQHAASLMRRGRLPYSKYRRFLQKELDLDKFIARQLTDTSYITRATAEYLRCLFDQPHHVLGLKGQHTAELRWQWGLNSILRDDNENRKSRDDHRHHAIDAIVVALTNRSRLRALSGIRKAGYFDRQSGEIYEVPQPWQDFRSAVEQRIAGVNVSHRVRRKVQGALHDEMPYGPTLEPGIFVKRKPITDLSANEIDKIRDEGIKRIIIDHLKKNSLEFGRGKKVDAKKLKAALSNLQMPSGVPIKKVRLLIPEQTVQPIRERKSDGCADDTCIALVRPGDNHHACIFEWEENGTVKRDAEYVSRLEASRRLRDREPLVRRHHSKRPEARFVMSLCSGDLVLADFDGQERVMVVSTLVSTQKRVHFVDARDARRSSDKKNIGLSPNSLIEKYNVRKVTVDPLGRIRWAND